MAAPRNDNVKQKIIISTEKLLATKNLSDISLAEIAAESGISKGTLYYYYKNKTDILFDITDNYLNEQYNDLVVWTENKEKDTSVHRLIKYVVERNIASAGIRLHLLNSAMLGDKIMRDKLVERYRVFQKLISEKIAERTNLVSADYLTWLILLASDGLIVQEALKNTDIDIDGFISQTADYMKMLEKLK